MVVCKLAFASLYGVNTSRVDRVLERSNGSTTSPQDKCGKHDNRPNRLGGGLLEQIDQHIRSFPVRSSHYSRSDSHGKKYLHEELSV